MRKLVMALDQGTTSSRTIIFDDRGEVVSSASAAFPCHYPKSGWVEQDPHDLWSTQRTTMEEALSAAHVSLKDVSAIGITNQRETTIAWNRDTGEPVTNAIVWQCRRTAKVCDELKREGFDKVIKKRTGLVTDAYFSGTKMQWILKNVPEARRLAKKGRLCFGTVDSWLVWNLTGGTVHVADASNASRTMLYDIVKGRWDPEIMERLGIPAETLPEVHGSSEIVGHTEPRLFGAAVPIAGIAGDQQAALFGQACLTPGMAKNTYGTGCFMLMNTGSKPVFSKRGLLTTIAWQLDEEVTYALEGSVFIAGALIQWLRDSIGVVSHAAETEQMAQAVPSSGGVYVVPAFVGLGAPHWDPYARGTIVGLTRDTNRQHLARAALEAIAFQSKEVLEAMELDSGTELALLRVDGGASANSFLCQFQADILGCTVSRPRCIETTALGAALLAGLATGVWEDFAAIRDTWREERAFKPDKKRKDVPALLAGWRRAVERSRGWIQEA